MNLRTLIKEVADEFAGDPTRDQVIALAIMSEAAVSRHDPSVVLPLIRDALEYCSPSALRPLARASAEYRQQPSLDELRLKEELRRLMQSRTMMPARTAEAFAERHDRADLNREMARTICSRRQRAFAH